MNEEKVLTREEVQQEMLDYIENKYNEEFEVYGIDFKSWDNGGVETMYAYPKGENPNYYFYVKRTGKNQITDDYVVFAMAKIYEEKAKEIIKKYFPDAVVQVGMSSSGTVPDSFRPDMNFEEFQKYANKKVDVSCGINLIADKEEDIDAKKSEALQMELKDLNKIGSISFFGYSEDDFNTYILNDPFNSEYLNEAYSDNGLNFQKDISWGQIDFDYKYKAE